MSHWDQRYQHSDAPGEVCWVLRNNAHLLPTSGRALDLACGLGANALFMAKRGLDVHAWDNSAVALQKLATFAKTQGLSVQTSLRDIEQQPPLPHSFDVIVVSHFLHRPLFPALIEALMPGGLLLYQTFHDNKLSASGPNNPDFLLQRGELLKQLAELQLLFYREDGDVGDLSQGLRDSSYFVGQKSFL